MTNHPLPAALFEDLVELVAQALIADLEAYPKLEDVPSKRLPVTITTPRKRAFKLESTDPPAA